MKIGDKVEFWELTEKSEATTKKLRRGEIVRLNESFEYGFAKLEDGRVAPFGFSQIVHRAKSDPTILYGYRIISSESGAWKLHFRKRAHAVAYCRRNGISEDLVQEAQWDKEIAQSCGDWKWED